MLKPHVFPGLGFTVSPDMAELEFVDNAGVQ